MMMQRPLLAKTLLKQEELRRIKGNRLAYYKPYLKQLEFHRAGAHDRERLLMAANQVGKTLCGGAEFAMHLTGRYPSWWAGRVWHRPIVGWAAALTIEKLKDGVQKWLFGRPNQIGTGMIPKESIKDYSYRRGASDVIEVAYVQWGGGGDVQSDVSMVTQKSYDQGSMAFSSDAIDLGWCDEEPDLEVYTEFLTRTNTTGGSLFMTFTPLLGMSKTVMRFVIEKPPGTSVTRMALEDANHYTEAERETIRLSYPEHERDARTKGDPQLGSGRIFPIPDEMVSIAMIASPPPVWRRIAALDFGYEHPTAAVWAYYDADTDIVYIYDAYRQRHGLVPVHAGAILARGAWIPMAWPRDGLNETAVGPQLSKQYRDMGVNMLQQHAQYEVVPGDSKDNPRLSKTSREAGLMDMLTRFQTGRLKVASHLTEWFEEFRLYHRQEGKVVELNDDLMSATRYLIMSLRFAESSRQMNRPDPNRGGNWRTL
jgi:phage terminase large subunit-like protein